MSEHYDAIIIGAGAAGGVVAKELTAAGLKVVVLEAGPHWDPQKDWVSDELIMDKKLAWRHPRFISGQDPLSLAHNNSGTGVGGGTNHFSGVLLRFHPSDFKTRTLDGVGEDWPIDYSDLEPYYTKIEKEIAVSGPKYFPWGAFNGPYPYPERNPLNAVAEVFRRGCEELGIKSVPAPLGILSAPFDGRPPCTNRGFCNQGCIPDAKFSTLITYFRKALEEGCKIIDNAFVTQILRSKEGKVTGAIYIKDRQEYQVLGRVVILAAYCIETPRLLLNCQMANSSGLVGKYLMTHSSDDVYGKFTEEIRSYKGSPVMALTQDFYETKKENNFTRGYTINSHGTRPLQFIRPIIKQYGFWGKQLRTLMEDYNYWARLTLVGEVLPHIGNQVAIGNEKDEFGVPIPEVTFSYGLNDLNLINHGVGKMEEILKAAGAVKILHTPDTAHLMGGCRMGKDPQNSVVNEYGQSHDIPNLFISDASVFVTSGGGNPTLTVMALANRTADFIINQMQQKLI